MSETIHCSMLNDAQIRVTPKGTLRVMVPGCEIQEYNIAPLTMVHLGTDLVATGATMLAAECQNLQDLNLCYVNRLAEYEKDQEVDQ